MVQVEIIKVNYSNLCFVVPGGRGFSGCLAAKMVTNFSSALTEPRVRTVVSTVRGGAGAAAASPLMSPHPRIPLRPPQLLHNIGTNRILRL